MFKPRRHLLSPFFFGAWFAAALPAFASDSLAFKDSTLKIEKNRSGLHWAKLNNDALPDLLIADDRQFQIYFQLPGGGFSDEASQSIPVPEGGIYDLADLDGDGAFEIVLLGPSSVELYKFDAASKKMAKTPAPLLTGLRGIPVQHLVPADVLTDIDGDGDEDLIYPIEGKYYLYFNDHGAFTKKNQITTKPIAVKMSMGQDEVPAKLSASVSIPGIEFTDLNGDGRKDLHASNEGRESFYLQGADGGIPEKPSYDVDLSRFKGDQPAKKRWANIDSFQFLSKDLNADGRQDYTIVSGNKIWVFLATANGVDFTKPNQILKVSAESMNAVLLSLNKDDFPDLVIVKYQLPSLGRVVAGLAIGLRFEVEFLGYDNSGANLFSRRPDHKSLMVFKVPPILKLIGELDSITKEFRDVQNQLTTSARGDFNGDGRPDILRFQGESMEFYFGLASQGKPQLESVEDYEDDEFITKTLFGEKQRDVTLDTLLSIYSDFVNSFTSATIAGRQPNSISKIDKETAERIDRVFCTDLNGDGLDDVVLFLSPKKDADGQKTGEADDSQILRLWLSQK